MTEKTKRRNLRKRLLLTFLAVMLVYFLIVAVEVASFATVTDQGPAEAAVVLGASAWRDQPSPVFQARINHAIELYQSGRVKALIFTGGVGPGKQYAEGAVARDYAVRAGVPVERVYYEDVSDNTYDNLVQAKSIFDGLPPGRVLIVSDPYHMFRAMLLARDLGMDAAPSPTPYSRYQSLWNQARFLARETWYCGGYLVYRVLVGMGNL